MPPIPKGVKGRPKVLIPLYDIQDYGGIINWVEHLCLGLRFRGVDPVLVKLENRSSVYSSRSSRPTTTGATGIPYDQRAGWVFPADHKVPLRSVNWAKYTSRFSGIIWAIPVPSKKKLFPGWKELYATPIPQVMVIHDGNLPKLYPWATEVMGSCRAVVGVHDCAHGSLGGLKNAELIPNPQDLRRMRDPKLGFADRQRRVISLQTFKRWKRVDDLVRAVPHMESRVELAGGGIEYYYMTSKDKRKEEYGTIWEEATAAGMKYLGYITEQRRDQLLAQSRLLVDASWSHTYAQYGSHFNRVFVDAIIAGCLPAGRDLLMDNNTYFDRKDYVTIPHDATPQEFGLACDYATTMSGKSYVGMVGRLQEVVREEFDCAKVAARYLGLIK